MKLFDIINIPFGIMIRFFNEITHNYLLALLLFAIVVKVVMLPLAIKQQKNQIKQARLRPLEQAIRRKYQGRNDKVTQQKVQEEVLALYQSEGYSPLSGCLPLLIQLPIIFSLYNIIRNPLTYICRISEDGVTKIIEVLKGLGEAVTDQMAQDQIALVNLINKVGTGAFDGIENIGNVAELNLNVFGVLDLSAQPSFSEFNWLWIIPILTFVTSYFGMKLTRKFQPQMMTAENADAAKSMKIMDFSMPLMSVFFTFMFSGAIGVYWIYQNVLNAVQTIIIAKAMPLPTITEEEIKAAERQLAGKAPKNARSELDPNRPRPRSLHHIDDDDEELPPAVPEKEEDETVEEEKPENPDAPKLKDSEKNKYRNK
ncbi:MAG: membrane protein insertase YidC [Clostridia bacterium]|nr:membrane protein insertase YidC [Clostridia bacterium]